MHSINLLVLIYFLQGEIVNINNPCCITPEEYFDAAIDLEGKDVGRPRELSTKTQKFKASISMAEGFPLTLQEQVLPGIIYLLQSKV